jgi:hypothetical protein
VRRPAPDLTILTDSGRQTKEDAYAYHYGRVSDVDFGSSV